MIIRNLKVYRLEENGELKHIGNNKRINIINRKYQFHDEPKAYLIEEYEHMKYTDYSKTEVLDPYVFRIHKENNFRCELCVKLNRIQALKYRLMFASAKTILGKVVSVFKAIIEIITT